MATEAGNSWLDKLEEERKSSHRRAHRIQLNEVVLTPLEQSMWM
jgi:hypothetical protein